MKYGFVIPVYNHGSTLEGVVKSIYDTNLPIIVVDDGNNEQNRKQIEDVAQKYSNVVVVTRKKNGGKGLAMRAGTLKAWEIGLTHVIQIDSDGQHDAGRVNHFMEKSMQNPDAVICGYPEYDEDAPLHRVKGRKIANGWIHTVTLSREIKDGMIGFRVYPVEPVVKLLKSHAIMDSRMGYDIDVLVHLSWKGVKIISESVKVNYPIDGISNFRVVQDNARISFMYARLCLGMIIRLPMLLVRKIRREKH